MPDPNIPPPPVPPAGAPPPPAPKQKHGCWFYGCLTLAILALLAAIGTWIAFRYFVKTASGWIEGYTSTNRIQIEQVSISQGELKSLQDRVASFSQASLQRARAAAETYLGDGPRRAFAQAGLYRKG